MKINELIEYMNQGKNKVLKVEQKQEVLKKILDVKKYMSIKDKKQLVEDIASKCIYYTDGILQIDNIEKYVVFTMLTIAAYTNLELSDDIEANYDMLCESELLNAVVNTFVEEYDSVNILLQMRCDYIENGNTIEAQFGKFLSGVSDKLDVLIDALSSKVKDMNIGDILKDIDPSDISKLLSFIKTIN